MFKISSFEQELIKEMQSRLLANQAENEYSFNKLAKAADYLNTAAELFDDVGMNKQAEAVTKILEKIAQDKSEDLTIIQPESAEKIISDIRFANLTVKELHDISEVVNSKIDKLLNLPATEVLDVDVEAPQVEEITGDFSDLRTSKKKV